MNISFDSNVWEKVVISTDKEESGYSSLKKLITSKKIQPYICEIALSLESIAKVERLNFWQNYKPLIDCKTTGCKLNNDGYINVSKQITVSPNNEKHPGSHPKLKQKLDLANGLGFKVLRMTNASTVRNPEIPEKMLVNFKDKDFWEYAKKLAECSNFITEIKAGRYDYDTLKKEYGFQDLSTTQLMSKTTQQEKKFYKAVREWVDGDSLAAHYAFGNDIFCTEDKAKSAGEQSVFSNKNITVVKSRFDINVLPVNAVLQLMF